MATTEFAKKATRGYAWNYLYKMSEFGLTYLFSTIVIRRFGPEISAPYIVFATLAPFLAIVSAFAVDGVLLRYIQRIAGNEPTAVEQFDNIESLSLPHFLNTMLAFRLLMIVAVSIIAAIVLIILPIYSPSLRQSFGTLTTFAPQLILYLFAFGINAFSTYALTGLLETRRVFISSIISRSLLLGVGVWLVFTQNLSLDAAINVFVGSFVVSALLTFTSLRHEVRLRFLNEPHRRFSLRTTSRLIRQFLRSRSYIGAFLATPLLLYGITTWGNDLLSTVLGKQPDILTMRIMLGEQTKEIGFYYSATQILFVTEYIFLFGLGGTLVSIFSKLAHEDEKQGSGYTSLAKARKEIAGFQNVVLLPLCTFVYLFIPKIVTLVYGSAFEPATAMVRYGLIAMIISVGLFGGGMQITSLVAIGKERLVFKNRLSWGIGNIILNIFLIYFFGAMGALIGTQYCNAGACATESGFASKLIGKSMSYQSSLRLFLIAVVAAVIPYEISEMMPNLPLILHVAIGAVIDILLVIGMYLAFRVPEAEIVKKRLRNLMGN
jgi:O-antigen/teichoic acid export membrane protein